MAHKPIPNPFPIIAHNTISNRNPTPAHTIQNTYNSKPITQPLYRSSSFQFQTAATEQQYATPPPHVILLFLTCFPRSSIRQTRKSQSSRHHLVQNQNDQLSLQPAGLQQPPTSILSSGFWGMSIEILCKQTAIPSLEGKFSNWGKKLEFLFCPFSHVRTNSPSIYCPLLVIVTGKKKKKKKTL
ncbi:hypothetical protein RDI58_004870 [Solanum bulbocastanum]|uniref:Uncharacterized protein n=1 Tax=Solanum bulbocastanum TaxID=147425 RepID=A0AAN8U6R2_SOLBU